MILCLDIGNSQIFGGVFKDDELALRFRYTSTNSTSSDQLGVFLRSVLRENSVAHEQIDHIAICSVVPSLDYSIRSACIKYFDQEPFVLQAGVKTGLRIKYHNPVEVGADRIANAIAATNHYPDKNLIIIDYGTATTYDAITANKDYLGGAILAGIRLSTEALQANTAKLSAVEIIKPKSVVGRSTTENIQSGIYYNQLATLQVLTQRITDEVFDGTQPYIIGTGGFAHLFENEGIFSTIEPNLVLHGLRHALALNHKKQK